MTAAGGLLLALVCLAIVGLALGLAVACWDFRTRTWGPRILRGSAVTVGATCLLLAVAHPIAQALSR